ncbi:MAG: M1 family metallopeptidase [Chitinophagales bacterium]
MKLKVLGFSALAVVLFIKCDPTKKMYHSEEYQGDVDTTNVPLGDNDYNYDYDYDYDYEDSDYSDYEYYNDDTVVSPYSNTLYRASEKRVNDLLDTKLKVSFDMDKAWMYGQATLTLKPYFYPTNTLSLDAKGFEIKEVSMITPTGRKPLAYTYNRDTIPDTFKIEIDLGRTYTKNETYQIYIDYIAKPNSLPHGGSAAITDDKGLYFINNKGEDKEKPVQIWTQGETEATSCWCPTIDKPNERCTDEIAMTVDKKYITLSNGVMVSSKANADGTRTDTWRMDKPHAPYLFMMAVGDFAVVHDKWKNIPVDYYVEHSYEKYARAIFGNTPEMIDFFSNKLGVPYAWPKYAQIVVRDYVSGAMENTSATLHGEFLQQTSRELLDDSNEDVISHELFHQWFGDLVTCESWSNIPLNESFATYGEYLWREYKYGRDDADQLGENDLQTYMNEAGYKQVNTIRFNYDTREDMFDSHSYAKGGRILHMLRKYLGDDAFFAGLQKYLNDNAYNSVEIENLRLAMESVSGEDLHWFFDEWFLNSGHPSIDIYYDYDADNGIATVHLTQYQDTATAPVYVLPLDVDIYMNGKVERHRIYFDRMMQDFTFNCPVKPDLINVDAEKQLLGYKEDYKSTEEYVFQYNHGPLYMDRMESVEWLAAEQNNSTEAYNTIVQALDDKHWSIRKFALDTIVLDNGTSQAVKDKIMYMCQHDPKSYVRASALARLTDITGIDAWSAYLNAIMDSSYSVVGTALVQIYNNDEKKGVEYARKYTNTNNFNLNYTVMSILGNGGDAIDNAYFMQQFAKATGFEGYFVMLNYEPFLQRMTDSEIIIQGVDALKKYALDDANFWVSYTASGIIAGLVTTYQEALANETDPQIKRSLQAALDHTQAVMDEISAGQNNDY